MVAATAVDSAEGAQRQAGTSAEVPAVAASALAVVGDIRTRPTVPGEESAETTAAKEGKGGPAVPAARAADFANTSPPRPIPVEESREATPSREAGSMLVVVPGDVEPSDAFLEAMAREESWSQMVRGGGPSLRLDDAALDVARAAIDAVRTQAGSHLQAIGQKYARLEALGGRLRAAILRHRHLEKDAVVARERMLKEATTALDEARGKSATADSRAGELLREKEEHLATVKSWDLACKEREGKLALREDKIKDREDSLAAREGAAEVLAKREAEATRLVDAATQEREALETRANELTAAERSHQAAVADFKALQAASEKEREKEVLAQVDVECRQLLVSAAIHVFSRLLCIDASFELKELFKDVPEDVAGDLAERVRETAESFAEAFGPDVVDGGDAPAP